MAFETSDQEFVETPDHSAVLAPMRYSPSALPGALLVANERDIAGRIFSDRRGRAHRYDGAGRIVETIQSDGQWQGFAYGATGLIDSETTPHLGDRRFDYNGARQLVAVTSGEGITLIGYDQRGRRRAESRPDGSAVEYVWNERDQLEDVHTTTRTGRTSTRRIGLVDSTRSKPVRIGDGFADDVFGWTATPGVHVGFRGELTVDGLVVMQERVYDPSTRQFLSPETARS